MQPRHLVACASAFCLLLAGCSSDSKDGTDGTAKALKNQTPEQFVVNFETTKGDFKVAVERKWAPSGADRFYQLTRANYFDGCRFYRVMKGYVAQFGINGDPDVNEKWRRNTILDDPSKQSNARGTLTFARAGINSRTTDIVINLSDNQRLDGTGFVPFGKVIKGMDVVDALYSGYGDVPPNGDGPDPVKIEVRGNDYLLSSFSKLDFIKKATIQ